MDNRSTLGRQAARFYLFVACVALPTAWSCQAPASADSTPPDHVTAFHSGTFVGNVRVIGNDVANLPDQQRVDAMFLGLLRGQRPWSEPEVSVPVTHELLVTVVNDVHHDEAIIVVLAWTGEWRDIESEPVTSVTLQLELPYQHQRAGFLAEPERALGSDLEHFANAVSDNLTLRIAADADITAALQNPDERTVELALREAARRHLLDATPAVRALISHSSESVALAAIGSSAELRDPLAARPAILRCEQGSVPFLVAAMPAIDRIGGEDAEFFLRALSQGHASTEVRVRAQGLLAN